MDSRNHVQQTEPRAAAPTAALEIPPAPVERRAPAYKKAVFSAGSQQDPHEAPPALLADLAERIVTEEGPIHTEEAAGRIASCFGKERTGARILEAARKALMNAKARNPEILTEDDFWFTLQQQETPQVRDRSEETGKTSKAAFISGLEIRAAINIAREDNPGSSDTDLIRTAARLLGFRRVTEEIKTRIASYLTPLETPAGT